MLASELCLALKMVPRFDCVQLAGDQKSVLVVADTSELIGGPRIGWGAWLVESASLSLCPDSGRLFSLFSLGQASAALPVDDVRRQIFSGLTTHDADTAPLACLPSRTVRVSRSSGEFALGSRYGAEPAGARSFGFAMHFELAAMSRSNMTQMSTF